MAKIAIITGASQGIGRGIALHLARAGYDIGFSYCSAQEQAESLTAQIEALGRRCRAYRADMCQSGAGPAFVKQAAEELGVPYHGWMREMDRAWISEDQKYSVMSRLLRTEWGKVEHVTITAAEGVGRSDGSGDIPWAVKMEIKNDLFGEKRVAVEVFPTQDRLVDVCDCYHLWVFEKGFQLPFGIHPRDKKTVTVNRGSTRVRAIDGAGREHSIKELLEENGAADVPKQAYAQAMAGYMMKNLLGG